jgi:transposase
VDLSAIDGMDEVTAHIVLTEVGPDFSAFGSASEFCSWLRLCPNNKVSGGRILARQTRKGKPRLALALRTAAQTLHASQSPMGEYFRRMRAKFGPAKAITAAAHKMARVIFHMVTTKQAYDDSILAKQDAQQRQKREAKIRRQAREIGYQLTPLQAA